MSNYLLLFCLIAARLAAVAADSEQFDYGLPTFTASNP